MTLIFATAGHTLFQLLHIQCMFLSKMPIFWAITYYILLA